MTANRQSVIVLAGLARGMPLDALKIKVRCSILWKRWGASAAAAALVCLGAGLRWMNLSNVTGRTPDESVYTKQANVLLQNGNAGLRGLVDEYQRDPTTRLFPPPTRVGYLWMLVTTMRIKRGTDESVGAYLSFAASVGSLVLVALLGLRFFPPWAAVMALLFFAVFPSELELARRTWGDAFVELLALGLLCVSAEMSRASRRPLWYVLFAMLGGCGVLVKESWPIVLGLCMAWMLWALLIELHDWKSALILLVSVLAAVCASVAWLASWIGGLAAVASIVPNLIHANSANPYALEYQTGPAYLLLRAFWILTPVTAVACAVGMAAVLLPHAKLKEWRHRDEAANWPVIRWTTVFLLGFLMLPMILPHWLNLRYVSPLFGPLCLLAGVGLWWAFTTCRECLPRAGRMVLALVLMGGLAAAARKDYQRFRVMFVENEVGDLSIKLLLDPASLVAPRR